jgi:hypothetical protein
MAVAINCPAQVCPVEWLHLQDDELSAKFRHKSPSSDNGETYNEQLVRFHIERQDTAVSYDDDDLAENFFYGRFSFTSGDPPIRVVAIMQQAFIEWSHQGLALTRYKAEEMGVSGDKLSDPVFIGSCAANYLLKNFWHNYVHNVLQQISFENYKHFGGLARYEADFEADNLANLFLIHSYGLQVRTSGFSTHEIDIPKKIIQLLRRNQCNKVFALRAAARRETQDHEELAWRYRRTLSSYLSGWLAAIGFSVTAIGVYLRPTQVVISLNGIRIAVDQEPNLGVESELRHSHFKGVAVEAGSKYRRIVLDHPNLASYASHSLLACFTRARLELAEEVMKAPDERPLGIQIVPTARTSS